MKPPENSIFHGDGRFMLEPVNAPISTRPVRLRRGIARFLACSFEYRGESYHSSDGATTWVIVTYCLERDIPYEIDVHRLDQGLIAGYTIRRKQ